MASRFLASRAAPFLKVPVSHRRFCYATFGPPASKTINEKEIKEEMRLLFPQHLKQKCSEGGLFVIRVFKYPLKGGQLLTGSNVIYFERKEDEHNEDKGTLVSGYRYLGDPKKGVIKVGSFESEYEEN